MHTIEAMGLAILLVDGTFVFDCSVGRAWKIHFHFLKNSFRNSKIHNLEMSHVPATKVPRNI
jgi:hypothetical protein